MSSSPSQSNETTANTTTTIPNQNETTTSPTQSTQSTQSTPPLIQQYPRPYPGRRLVSVMADIYHEKQQQQHCAVHTINNIVQYGAYSNKIFDDISRSFSPDSWINPHKSVFGTGNYDANVLLGALSLQTGLESIWLNKKKNNLDHLNVNTLAGVIVNVITSSFLWWEQRHWLPLVPVLVNDNTNTNTATTNNNTGDNDDASPYYLSNPQPRNAIGQFDRSIVPINVDNNNNINKALRWFNLNPLNNKSNNIDLIRYLKAVIKDDKDAIIIFVLLPGVDSDDIWISK